MTSFLRHIVLPLVFYSFSASAWGEEFAVPPLSGRIVDTAHVISAETQRSLQEALVNLDRQGKAQVAILTVPSLQGHPIEDASIKVVDAWKLGKSGKDNGLLLFVAVEDRKVRLEVGRGLEGDIPDIVAKKIIREQISPFFRRSQYGEGLLAALLAIDRRLSADEGGTVEEEPERNKASILIRLFIVLIIIFILSRFFAGPSPRSSFHRGHQGWGGGYWGGGSSSGGYSGGGDFSGGGGGFSGGGASGDW